MRFVIPLRKMLINFLVSFSMALTDGDEATPFNSLQSAKLLN